MQFKQGNGRKACCDEEIDAETFSRLGTPEYDDWDSGILIGEGRHLYTDVDEGYGEPYSHVSMRTMLHCARGQGNRTAGICLPRS